MLQAVRLRLLVGRLCFALLGLTLGIISLRAQAGAAAAVQIVDLAYSPTTLTIDLGQTVSWTNSDTAPHTITAANNSWKSPSLATGATFTRTFTQQGSFNYYCEIHPTMTGQVVVGNTPTPQPRRYLPLIASGDTPFPGPTRQITASGTLWSDPAAWGGTLPQMGDAVFIPAGVAMNLDITTPALYSLRIDGMLTFAEKDLELNAGWIMVHGTGKLQVGSEAKPFTRRATISLSSRNPDENVMGMGTKFLGTMMGGTIDMHGQPKRSWTRLNANAPAGTATIMLADAPTGWRVGDQIAIAPSDFNALEAEQRSITAINGTTITLDRPLTFAHWGAAPERYGSLTLDMRAHVGNLSRNIVVRGTNTTAKVLPGFDPNSFDSDGRQNGSGKRRGLGRFGGHMMFMEDSTVRLQNIEVTAMGQEGVLARYPVHWHLTHDSSVGNYIKGSSIHTTFQRGLVLHQANGVIAQDNVLYSIAGHGVYLEDGIEHNNTLARNLVIRVEYVMEKHRLSVFDADGDQRNERLAGFWLTNPNNTVRDNVVAGVVNGWGYSFEDVRTDKIPVIDSRDNEFQYNQPLGIFSGNSAYAIGFNRQRVVTDPDRDRWPQVLSYGPEEAGSCFRFTGSVPYMPAPLAASVTPTNLTAFKCENVAFWSLPPTLGVTRAVVADSRAVAQADSGFDSVLRDSVAVAMTRNNPPGRTKFEGALSFDGPWVYSPNEGGQLLVYDNVRVVGKFLGSDMSWLINPLQGQPGTMQQDFRVRFEPRATNFRAGETVSVPVSVDRSGGYNGEIRIRPDFKRLTNMTDQDALYYLNPTQAEFVIPAGATSGSVAFRFEPPANFPSDAIAAVRPFGLIPFVINAGDTTKFQPVPANVAHYATSRPNENVAFDFDGDIHNESGSLPQSGPQGERASEWVDGNHNTAFPTGTWDALVRDNPWIEVNLLARYNLRELRIWSGAGIPTRAGTQGASNVCVFVSDFPFRDDLTLTEAQGQAGIWSSCINGNVGKPSKLVLPVGTTGRYVRIWMRGTGTMSLAEIEAIGR